MDWIAGMGPWPFFCRLGSGTSLSGRDDAKMENGNPSSKVEFLGSHYPLYIPIIHNSHTSKGGGGIWALGIIGIVQYLIHSRLDHIFFLSPSLPTRTPAPHEKDRCLVLFGRRQRRSHLVSEVFLRFLTFFWGCCCLSGGVGREGRGGEVADTGSAPPAPPPYSKRRNFCECASLSGR